MRAVLKFVTACFLVAVFLWLFMLVQSIQARNVYIHGYVAGAEACLERDT